MKKYPEVLDEFVNSSPFTQSLIGFRPFFNELASTLSEKPSNYPPFNIIQLDENNTLLEMALAGYKESDIKITVENSQLLIQAEALQTDEEKTYLYKGISARAFTRKFALAEHLEVKEAKYSNGMLSVYLERIIPEALKPKRIAISSK